MTTKSNFVSYLQANAATYFGVDKPTTTAVEVSLDLVLAAYLQMTNQQDALPKGRDPYPEIIDLTALDVAKRIANGEIVVIYNPNEVRYYYCVAHKKALFAVFYAITPGTNIYGVICNSKKALIDIGITGATTSDLKIIAKIFNFEPPEVVVTVKPTPTVPVGQEIPPMTWYSVDRRETHKKDEVVVEETTTETEVVVVRHHVATGNNNQMARALHEAGVTGQTVSKPNHTSTTS